MEDEPVYKLQKLLCSLILVASFILLATPALAQTKLASWNIQHLGTQKNKDYEALAQVASNFDFIAIQEVMNLNGLEKFHQALESFTQEEWSKTYSHLVGRGSYKEKYAFIWRNKKVKHLGGDLVYLDNRDVFAREPFSAQFQTADGFKFIIANIHAIYGRNVEQRQKEATALRSYYDWLQENFPGEIVFITGDFNLAPTNPAWNVMQQAAHPMIQEGATTISTIDGRFANLYDNFWMPVDTPLPISSFGRLEFPHKILGITHEQARASVSDHIPVWVELNINAPNVTFEPAKKVVSAAKKQISSTPVQNQKPVIQHKGAQKIIGNRNSKIYHWPGCPSYSKVSPQNQVYFNSPAEAEMAGYRAARNC